MAKISPVSIKYIVRANVHLTGVVERPDVIGAVFGQTEGLLGSELELRELQKSGRIGRIDVKLTTKAGKTEGEITLPSSMGKSETAIIAAALETIERVGPCDAKIQVRKIDDVRISKQDFILKRAKELLKNLVTELPDSQAITNQVAQTVRTMEIVNFGPDKNPAGPGVEDAEEIILVEGRADVINLLKYGIRNAIALNGTSASKTIVDLMKTKEVTLFIDGDRGGDLIVKKMAGLGEIDYVAKAPDGKEVEELTLKELHKALRAKIAWSQVTSEVEVSKKGESKKTTTTKRTTSSRERPQRSERTEKTALGKKESKILKGMLEEIIGTRGAFILDKNLNILGRVPLKELSETLKEMSDVFAVVLDGAVDQKLQKLADSKNLSILVCKTATGLTRSKVKVLTQKDL